MYNIYCPLFTRLLYKIKRYCKYPVIECSSDRDTIKTDIWFERFTVVNIYIGGDSLQSTIIIGTERLYKMTAEPFGGSLSKSSSTISRHDGSSRLPYTSDLKLPLQDINNNVEESLEEENSGYTYYDNKIKKHDSGYVSQSSFIREKNEECIQNTIQSFPDIPGGNDSLQIKQRPTCIKLPFTANQECNSPIKSDSIESNSPEQFFTAPTSVDLDSISQEQPAFCNTQSENMKAILNIQNCPVEDTKNIEKEISSIDLATAEGNDFSYGRNPKISSQKNSQNWKSLDICPACGKPNIAPTIPPPPPPRRSKSESSLSEETLRLTMKKYEEYQGHIREKVIKMTIRQNFVTFRDSTDFTVLIAHLNTEELLHPAENEILNNLFYTQVYKANCFYLEMLDRKGPKAYRHFYSALKAEKAHKGHHHLLEMLDQALSKE